MNEGTIIWRNSWEPKPVCPYCGERYWDWESTSSPVDGSEFDHKCKCGETYKVRVSVQIEYDTGYIFGRT